MIMSTHKDINTCIVTGHLNSVGPSVESSLCSELLVYCQYRAIHYTKLGWTLSGNLSLLGTIVIMSTHTNLNTCIVTGQLNSVGPLVESSLHSELLFMMSI